MSSSSNLDGEYKIVKLTTEIIPSDLPQDELLRKSVTLADCSDELLLAELARRKYLTVEKAVTKEMVMGRFKFVREVGHSSWGAIAIVKESDSKAFYSCRVADDESCDPEVLKRLRTEIGILKSLQHGINIASEFYIYESSTCQWIITEYSEEGLLSDALATTGRFSEEVAGRFTRQIMSAIDFMHNAGVVHRSLRCKNIVLKGNLDSGVLKLTNFGLGAIVKLGHAGYHAVDGRKRKKYSLLVSTLLCD
jgi:serine/threonine protein kinase